MERIVKIEGTSWQQSFPETIQQEAINALEQGKVLFFPQLGFHLEENELGFLIPSAGNGKAKNISYNLVTNRIANTSFKRYAKKRLKKMMARYANSAQTLLNNLLPFYSPALKIGRTSYRPVQALNRASSYRKDDRRLHIDAFPSTPMGDKRILRVFCNINPASEDRVWRIGEPFPKVVEYFKFRLAPYEPFKAKLLKWFHITKSYRTAYDHYMLQLHDTMKEDSAYQHNVDQQEVRFPPGSTWIVFSDCTSHAAMSGQYMLEQTYYLPYKGMQNPKLAPQVILAPYGRQIEAK